MNDFYTVLEIKLRQLLDPVVAQRPPTRRGRIQRTPHRVLTIPAADLAAEPIPVVAPAPRLLS